MTESGASGSGGDDGLAGGSEADGPGEAGDADGGESDGTASFSAGGVLAATLRRVAARPWLLAPFVLLGAWVSVVDVLRLHGAVPVTAGPWLADGHVTVHLPVYPGGLARTVVPPESVVGLRPAYLLRALALSGSVLVGTGLATAATVTWASSRLGGPHQSVGWPRRPAAGRLVGYVVAVAAVRWTFSALAAVREEFALVALLVGLTLAVRLFAAPSLLAHGATYRTAVLGSNRLVRGHDWSVLGVALVAGLAAYALASVPVAGGALSTAVAGPVLAVASLVVHRAVVESRG